MFIDIPEPCHEDWSSMSPSDKGRHCASCNKVVVDFVQMDSLAAATMLVNGNDVCGHISSTKLSKLNILLPLLMAGAAVTTSTQAQALPEIVPDSVTKHPVAPYSTDDTVGISGTVTDSLTKYPIPFANVLIYNHGKLLTGTKTDFDGKYRLEIPRNQLLPAFEVRFNDAGYEHKTLTQLPALTKDYVVSLKEGPTHVITIMEGKMMLTNKQPEEPSMNYHIDGVEYIVH